MKNSRSRQSIIDLWSACERQLGVNRESRHIYGQNDPFRRIYFDDEAVIKVEFPGRMISASLRTQDVVEEYAIYKECASIKGVAQVIQLRQGDGFNAIFLEKNSGRSISPIDRNWVEVIRAMISVAMISIRLAMIGIAHNDLVPANILIDTSGKVTLIDFDQALKTSSVDAITRSFFGISSKKEKVYASVFKLFGVKIRGISPPKLISALRRTKNFLSKDRFQLTLPRLSIDASMKQRILLEAWELGQVSDANAPGKGLAYYGVDIDGVEFPGERPWLQRWSIFSELADYREKKILELGCNMGLLSSYLLMEGGAKACLGTDIDETILQSARLVANAFNVKANFECVDFDCIDEWERRLLEFGPDIVFALNVLNWVKNKERFLEFLGRFPCLIYEGHDSFEIEEKRLRGVGFKTVEFICQSERFRPLIICNKKNAQVAE